MTDAVLLSLEDALRLLVPQPRHVQWSDERLYVDRATPVTVVIDSTLPIAEQGYELTVREHGIEVKAATAQGAFYGEQTLVQLKSLFPEQLPGLKIEDSPSFQVRGFMLDISRDKVPTMDTLRHLVGLIAELKLNQLQLYTEHTFAYEGHEVVWEGKSPMTADEIRTLDGWCKAHHIELVPNQNSFGHMHRWLVHEPYRQCAERPEGIEHAFSPKKEPYGLNPVDPQSLALLADLYDQLLPNFTSHQCNVGLDETIDLGTGGSKDACDARGKGRVYVEFVQAIDQLLKQRGVSMQFWGDIILNHPELISELPKDAVVLEWGYEANHPFDEHGRQFSEAGLDFYVCPGTSGWNALAGRTDNAVANLANAAVNGERNGAKGYLITDWGDNGHLQPLPVSYPGLFAGAAYSWNTTTASSPLDLDLPASLNVHLFQDPTGITGKALCDLGNVYRQLGLELSNRTLPFLLLVLPEKNLPRLEEWGVTSEQFNDAKQWIERVVLTLKEAAPRCHDGDWVLAELQWLADAMTLGINVGEAGSTQGYEARYQALAGQHRALWLTRNRPGGLSDSASRLERFA